MTTRAGLPGGEHETASTDRKPDSPPLTWSEPAADGPALPFVARGEAVAARGSEGWVEGVDAPEPLQAASRQSAARMQMTRGINSWCRPGAGAVKRRLENGRCQLLD
jgi:hypothetical protein